MIYSGRRRMSLSHSGRPAYDAFDSLEWDPELPTSSSPPDNSPKPISMEPRPIVYTTVGSLVDPAAVPQFSAPNRIQREGANRRPLLALLRSQQLDTAFPSRGQLSPLHRSTSMSYTQETARDKQREERDTSISNYSTHSTMSQRSLTEQEKDTLIQQFGEALPQISKGAQLPLPSKASNHVFHVQELLSGEIQGRAGGTQGPVQGLEKMQTLQRLAKFDNPMRSFAQSRLSEFAVSNPQITPQALNSDGPYTHGTDTSYSHLRSGSGMDETGGLNHDFQFPLPGFGGNSRAKENSQLYPTGQSSAAPAITLSRNSGYPQPLTAGPPGQRSYNSSLSQQKSFYDTQNRPTSATQDLEYNTARLRHLLQQIARNDGPEPLDLLKYPAAQSFDGYIESHIESRPQITSNSAKYVAHEIFGRGHVGNCTTSLNNTMPPCDAQRYYPNGWPSNYSSDWKPMSKKTQIAMDMAMKTDKERDSEKNVNLDEWFYDGQWEDNFQGRHGYLSIRQDLGPIGPPKKIRGGFKSRAVCIEELENMSLGEVARPFLEAACDTLSEYADRTASTSRANLSGLVDCHPDFVDLTAEGNKSVFGEDWGIPIRRQSSKKHD